MQKLIDSIVTLYLHKNVVTLLIEKRIFFLSSHLRIYFDTYFISRWHLKENLFFF